MNMNKIRKYLFVSLLVFLFCTNNVYAAETYTEGYFYYQVENDSVIITGYFGTESVVTVPSMIAGVPVNTIGEGAFVNTTVKTLNLPDTIMTIENGAIGSGVNVIYNSNIENSSGSEETNPASEKTKNEEIEVDDVGSLDDTQKNTLTAQGADTGKTVNELKETESVDGRGKNTLSDTSASEDNDLSVQEQADVKAIESENSSKEYSQNLLLLIIVIGIVGACGGLFIWKRKR
jgi:hypothetical protein